MKTVHAIADCLDCDWHNGDFQTARIMAQRHSHQAGHTVSVVRIGYNEAKDNRAMDNEEFDRRVSVIEDALYALKDSGYADTPDVEAIDNMLAIKAELKVELYGFLLGWSHGVPLPDEGERINNALADPNDCPGHRSRHDDPKRCRYCGTHVDEERV